jgi:hypothetical protein
MIELSIQIKSLIFSFFYGILFFLLLKINYKYIYGCSLIYKIIINLLFVMNNVILYFIILKKINNGIIHFYFILMIIAGYFTGNYHFRRIKIEIFK